MRRWRTRVYPRVCGGTAANATSIPACAHPWVRQGSIPACAGGVIPFTTVRVYPRVCGGTQRLSASWTETVGLSPRVRGNRPHATPSRIAGLSPRVRGNRDKVDGADCPGLSPRVRGNRANLSIQTPIPACAGEPAYDQGSIPACAGEPKVFEPPGDHSSPACRVYPRVGETEAVYPRVCGGTCASRAGSRVRGNQCG